MSLSPGVQVLGQSQGVPPRVLLGSRTEGVPGQSQGVRPNVLQSPAVQDKTPRDCPRTPSVLDPRTLDGTNRNSTGTPSVQDLST